jgi:predicted nuclease of predicted toxin-antitoxin system
VRILADENVHVGIIHRIRQSNYEILSVRDVGLDGHKDRVILEYSEEHNLILISGDKDFGGLIEFGTLWGRGKVILLRYHLIKTEIIATDIIKTIRREAEILNSKKSAIIVLSESGYRIHRPAT